MSTVTIDPGHILFGDTRRSVLALLLGRPDERFHLREVARLSGAGVGAVQRELASLVAGGILRREAGGKQVYFQAERSSPIFAELQAIVQKTVGAPSVMRKHLRGIASRIRVAVIFGSMARGEARAESDVDLLIIADDLSVRELAGPIRRASTQLGREVNLNLYTASEWRERAAKDHRLVRSILGQPTLAVIGESDELNRLAEERVAQAAPDQPGRDQSALRRDRTRPARQRRRERR